MAKKSEFIGGPQELQDYLGGIVPLRTIYAWRVKGVGPKAYKVGRHVLYKKVDVDSWLESQADPTRVA